MKLRIAVGDGDRGSCDFLERHLPHLGHIVVSVANTIPGLAAHCTLHAPDLIVVGVRPPWATGLAEVAALARACPAALVACTDGTGDGWAEMSLAAGVTGHLLRPLIEREVGPCVEAAWVRWRQGEATRQEVTDLRRAVEDRKVVEQAKGAVTRRTGLGEDRAYRGLRQWASDRNLKLAEAARQILAAEEVFLAVDAPGGGGPHVARRTFGGSPATGQTATNRK